MWILKFIIPFMETQAVASRTRRYNVSVMGYPLSNFRKENKLFVFGTVYLMGEPKAKKDFLTDLKKDKRTIKVEMMDESFGFWLMEQYHENEIFFDPLILHVKPIIISQNGEYIFELASWNRGKLNNIAKKIESRIYQGKLISFKQEKIKSVSIVSFIPKLTEKQKRAVELAIQHGYYGYPRKVDIEQLAKIMMISYSTYLFHLRNAEKKLMPYLAHSS